MARCSIWRCGFVIKSSASAAPRSTRCTPRRWNVSTRQGPGTYEFGCKVSIVTPVTAPKGGQFVLHAKALHGNPYDGHTLGPVIADLEKLTGAAGRRIHGDKGYRDRINAVLAAAGYNFSLLRRWFEDFLPVLLSMFCHRGTTLRPE